MENSGKIWCEEELIFLKENYTINGSKYCSECLKRDRKTISVKAKRLGLKSGKNSYRYSKEYLEPIIKSVNTIKDVLEKIGLRAAGGNYQIINKYIKKYNINIDHFEINKKERWANLGARIRLKKIPLDKILIENSNYCRKNLKKRLYEDKLKERKCELCGQTEEWKGKTMSLILDHINGVHNDNRIDNLRIVCPNCNATLDTHAGKNNKNKTMGKNVKIINEIDRRTILTDNIIKVKINRRKVERPTLEILLNEIKELGYVGTGRKYGVSDNAIRKWVKCYDKISN